MKFRYAAMFTICCASSAGAQSTVQQSMPFDSCVQSLQTSGAGASQVPVTTVDTYDTKEVQFPVTDGQVTITCTRTDQQVTITHR